MLRDDDNDGRINEDGPDHLDLDGVIAQFRYKDPKGAFVIDDTDPRLMIRLGPDEQTAKTRYSVVTEDKDNDGDGVSTDWDSLQLGIYSLTIEL